MSDNKGNINRRTVLRTSGLGLGSISAGTMTVTASSDRQPDGTSDDCTSLERVASDDTYDVYRVNSDEYVIFVSVNKETKTVSYRRIDSEVLDSNDTEVGITEEDILPNDHDEIFEEYAVFTGNIGDCNGYMYDNHYTVGVSFRTGDSLDDVPSDALEAAVCAVLGTYAGGPWVGAAAAVFCVVLGSFILDHVDLSGHELSVAVWDCHIGWLNEEAVCMGYAPGWYDDLSYFHRTKKLSGPHLELGDDISNYL